MQMRHLRLAGGFMVAVVLQTTLFIFLGSSAVEGSSLASLSTNHRRQLDTQQTIPHGHHSRGVKVELMHRDHEQRTPGSGYSPGRRAERNVRFSKMRAEVLRGRGEAYRNRGGRSGLTRRSLRWGERKLISNFQSDVMAAPDEYLMSISLGTPPQNFVAVADTGSDLTWLQCVPCISCFEQMDDVFQPSDSSSYSNLTCSDDPCQQFLDDYSNDWVTSCPQQTSEHGSNCQYAYFYGDFSNTTGDFSRDTINLETIDGNITRIPNFAFGCSHSSFSPSTLFDETDGLVGLGQGRISFPAQLGLTYGDIFSYCLVNPDVSRSQTSTLLFGDVATENEPGLQYTPILTYPDNPTFYFVNLEGISIEGKQVAIPKEFFAHNASDGGTFFDSGTTLTLMEPRALDLLTAALMKEMNYTRVQSPYEIVEYCWNVKGHTPSQIRETAPRISFNFTGANYDLEFENSYVMLTDDPRPGSRLLCLALSSSGGNGSYTTIGNIQQRNFHVVFDRQKKRLGFVKRNCASGSTRIPVSGMFLPLQIVAVAILHGRG